MKRERNRAALTGLQLWVIVGEVEGTLVWVVRPATHMGSQELAGVSRCSFLYLVGDEIHMSKEALCPNCSLMDRLH